jgi:RNA exonuclease 1
MLIWFLSLFTEGQLSKTTDPSVYLLSPEQMAEQAYPLPSPIPSSPSESTSVSFEDWKRADGWIEAPWQKPGYGTRKVLGIDCEMVRRL